MSEKTKNIIAVICWIIMILLFAWYIVLAWELHDAKSFQRDVDRISEIDQETKNNSTLWWVYQNSMEKEVKDVKAKWEKKQAKLQLKNKELNEEKEEIQRRNVESLGLKMSSQAQ